MNEVAHKSHSVLGIVIATMSIIGTLVGVGIRIGTLSNRVDTLNEKAASIGAVAERVEAKLNALGLERAGDRDAITRNKDDLDRIARRIELLEERRR